jgi:hypothetical protein
VSAIQGPRAPNRSQFIVATDEPSCLIWQQERRHRLAHLGSRSSGIILHEVVDEHIDAGLEMWP